MNSIKIFKYLGYTENSDLFRLVNLMIKSRKSRWKYYSKYKYDMFKIINDLDRATIILFRYYVRELYETCFNEDSAVTYPAKENYLDSIDEHCVNLIESKNQLTKERSTNWNTK